MRSLFRRAGSGEASKGKSTSRTPRHSRGWQELLKFLQKNEGLRVLDVGPTSSNNINLITGLGHSIYMSNLVEEASRPEWHRIDDAGNAAFVSEEFLASNLQFAGRAFDVVLLWDTADYLPELLLPPLLSRLHGSISPGGQMLCFFHAKPSTGSLATPSDTEVFRYHLTATENLEMQQLGRRPVLHRYNNRQIESLLKDFSNFRFFLAKDNVREVLATC